MISLVNVALAAAIDTSLPGPYNVATTGPVGAIGNIYYFAMALGGLLAFGSIVFAGIKWTASRGNSSSISDAKDQITQALIGLLLLMGSFIVLNTINPQLTILKFPQLTPIPLASSTAGGGAALCGPKANGQTAACSVGSCEINPASTGDNNYYRCQVAASAVWVCYKTTSDGFSGVIETNPVGCYARSKGADCNSFCQGQSGDNGGQCQAVNPAPSSCPSVVN